MIQLNEENDNYQATGPDCIEPKCCELAQMQRQSHGKRHDTGSKHHRIHMGPGNFRKSRGLWWRSCALRGGRVMVTRCASDSATKHTTPLEGIETVATLAINTASHDHQTRPLKGILLFTSSGGRTIATTTTAPCAPHAISEGTTCSCQASRRWIALRQGGLKGCEATRGLMWLDIA